MRRFLTASFIAAGLFLSVASCADRVTGPRAVQGSSATNVNGVVSPDIVISQIYGGGGNSGAQYKNKFIELFNRGSSTVSLAGWSIQYAAATGTGLFSANSPFALSGSLAPGQYLLVQVGPTGSNGASLPVTPDLTASTNLNPNATTGKVIVANVSTGLACNGGSTACSPAQLAQIVDLVGYGGANFFEGAAAPTLSNSTAAFRKSAGCTETDNNASDFITGAPAPRNRASATNPCVAADLDHVDLSIVAPGTSTIQAGKFIQLLAEPKSSSNASVSAAVTWNSSNDQVASVDASGKVTGVAANANPVTITATATQTKADLTTIVKTATLNVTVVAPAVASITISPTSASIFSNQTQQFLARAFDANNVEITGTTFQWLSSDEAVAKVVSGLATPQGTAGDATITAKVGEVTQTATLHVDLVPPPPTTRFSELHYDNNGVDQGEAIEIEGPAGTDLTGWSIVLYNGNPADANFPLQAYNSRTLSGIIAARTACSGRGVMTFTYDVNGIQNGSPDGMALVDASNHVVEFLSYEGTFTAADGPAAGMASRDIGVVEDASTAAGRSLQRSTDGNTWAAAALSSFGRCNLEGPTPPENGITFSGRVPTDPPLPVGFEDQIFGTLHDGTTNAVIPNITFTWTSLTPAIATIDAKGVIHGVSPGTASFKATASDADHSSATYQLPIADPQPATGVPWNGNAEFGEPIGANDVIVHHDQFIGSFSYSRNIPNWIVARMDPAHIGAGVDRCDCFTYDPLVEVEGSGFRRYTTGDYTGAGAAAHYGIDRGHLLRSSDVTVSDGDNKYSYLFTNIVPQSHDMNTQGGPWFAEEVYLGELVRSGGKDVWIIAGASGSKGSVKGEGLITIPAFLWKVAVIMPHGSHLSDVHSAADVEVVARIYPNDPFGYDAGFSGPTLPSADWNFDGYKATVDQVEALSGYNLLDLLPDQIEIAVESNTKPPVASVNGPYAGAEGSAIAFSAAGSSDPDGDALTYAWDFGDGATGTGLSASHSYARYGDYNVRVTVTDTRGLFSTATATVHVDNVAPTLNPIAGGTIVVGNTFTTSGTFSDPGSDPCTATVDSGAGSGVSSLSLAGNGFTLSHTYAAHGSFTVTVTLSDGQASATRTAAVVVHAPPVANAGGPYSSAEGASLTFNGSASNDPDGLITTYAWNFGDGSTGSGATPAHTYAQDGSYTVTLVVTDNDGLASSMTSTVSVANVTPSVDALAGAAILPHETYSANGSFTDPGADTWTATVDYGDGSGPQALALTGKNFSLSHTYAAPGSYTVTVAVSDGASGGSRSATVTVKTLVQGAQDIAALLSGVNSLNTKLDAAINQLDRGNIVAALNQLNALLNEVDAMVRSGRMSSANAEAIRAAVNRLAASIRS